MGKPSMVDRGGNQYPVSNPPLRREDDPELADCGGSTGSGCFTLVAMVGLFLALLKLLVRAGAARGPLQVASRNAPDIGND